MDRNPFNFALGRALQTLRRERGIRGSSELATKLAVSSTTYRLVEAGRAVLPVHCVPPLAEVLQIDLARLAAATAVASALGEGRPDARKMQARARRVIDQYPPLRDALQVSLGFGAPGGPPSVLPGAPDDDDQASALLRQYLQGGPAMRSPGDPGESIPATTVSPFFTEIVETLLGQLAPTQPVMPTARVFGWIADRARQLRRLRLYFISPKTLDVVSGRDSFVWDVLRNPYRPRFQLVVPRSVQTRTDTAIRQTLLSAARRNPYVAPDKLAPRIEEMNRNIVLRGADDSFERIMQPFLDVGPALLAASDIDDTRNVCLVEYAPASAPASSRLVAFVGFREARGRDGREPERRSVVLDAAAAASCSSAFDAEWRRLSERARA
jgi:transcriptional regulator with XRE-family HTH domain